MDYDEVGLKPVAVLKPAWLSYREVSRFIKALRSAGIDLVFTGGAVRDAVIDNSCHPKDFDVFANASAEIIHKTLLMQDIKAEITDSGKVIATIDQTVFDLFNLPPTDCSDTSEWLSPESLRDLVLNFEFTLNTLVLTPEGALYDFFKARADIREKRVRFLIDPMQSIPANTLSRVMLRYFRFCAQYESPVDSYALAACNHHKADLQEVSNKPYLRRDFTALLCAPYAVDVLTLLQHHGMLADMCGVRSVSVAPLQTLMELEGHRLKQDQQPRRIAALLLGVSCEGSFEQGLNTLTQHLQLPQTLQKSLRGLLSLLPFINVSLPRSRRKALVKVLGESLDTLLMLRCAAEGHSTRAKELYLQLLQLFSSDGIVSTRLVPHYVAVRGGNCPYTLDHQYGFTLLELSIAMVIIGLLIGGVVVGKDLIHAAEIRATITQVERFNAAANAFMTKYNCLPGDCTLKQAQSFSLTAADPSTACGQYPADGNATIGYTLLDAAGNGFDLYSNWTIAYCGEAEVVLFWQHLRDAKLISDPAMGLGYTINSFTKINAAVPIKFKNVNAPDGFDYGQGGMSLTPGVRMAQSQYSSEAQKQFDGGHLFWITARMSMAPEKGAENSATLLPRDAYAIDRKLDDGLPKSGNVLASGRYSLNAPDEGTLNDLRCVNIDTTPASYNQKVTAITSVSISSACSITIKAEF
jgi:prepilin-type N-terminal cleavage/methylation domain-containing protein